MTELPAVEFHQQDWIEGFAAFLPDATTPQPNSRAFCVLNLGAILGMVATGDMPRSEMPYMVAESMMHEIIHVLEQWAGVEFNEERVEALLQKYAASAGGTIQCEPMDPDEEGWSEWIHPLPGYLMQCCDCGLIHEMEFEIGQRKDEGPLNPGEGDDDGVVIFRARRA